MRRGNVSRLCSDLENSGRVGVALLTDLLVWASPGAIQLAGARSFVVPLRILALSGEGWHCELVWKENPGAHLNPFEARPVLNSKLDI